MQRQFIKNVGFKYILNGRSLIVQLISMTKEDSALTNLQIEAFIKATSTYFDSVRNKKNLKELFGSLDFVDIPSFQYSKPFYKFIHKETYENFIKKGKFQLGSLKYYREIERQESRDEKEGFANLIINSGNRQILTSVISGFDKYILCGTYDIENLDYMSAKYGGYIMKINSVKSFAEKVMMAIGAESWLLNEINYTDYKAYAVDTIISDLGGVSPDLSEEMFNILYNISDKPCVYAKPVRFEDEKELRLSFTMARDTRTKLNFDNLGLLADIEIIKSF